MFMNKSQWLADLILLSKCELPEEPGAAETVLVLDLIFCYERRK